MQQMQIQTQQKQNVKAVWSARLKQKIITIQGQTLQSSSAPSIDVCGCASIDIRFAPGIYIWKIAINQKTTLLGIGLGLLSKIQQNNFLSGRWLSEQQTRLYMVVSDGMRYGQFVKQDQKKLFSFTVGDTIQVSYGSIRQRLEFVKEKTQEKFAVIIQPPPAGDRYVPCVYLCPNSGNSVELKSMEFLEDKQ